MILLRSALFNALFVLHNVLWFLACLPFLLGPRARFMPVVRAWAASNVRLHALVVGVRVEVRGLERLPPGGCLVASKHASAWETLALPPLLGDFAFVLKRELFYVPLFGLFLWKAGQVFIDRSKGAGVIEGMNRRVAEAVRAGRRVIIFPEGTRRPLGAPPAYRSGVSHLYAALGVPCVPVAHSAGLLWPRRGFLKRPGLIVLEVLEPIPPGMPREAFLALVRERVEAATDRLVAESRAASPGPAAGGEITTRA